MTQRDISDLTQDQVNWEQGIITRKRSKTANHENVPTVSYPLWSSTLSLLRQFHNKEAPTVLTTENGKRLKTEYISEEGKYRKIDNIQAAFIRLFKRTGIEAKPPKLIRKTSATLLAHSEYSHYAVLFLGHSPVGIAATYYIGEAGKGFADAIRWLGTQYGIE